MNTRGRETVGRRGVLGLAAAGLLAIGLAVALYGCAREETPSVLGRQPRAFTVAVFADVQYEDRDAQGRREYRASLDKFAEAVRRLSPMVAGGTAADAAPTFAIQLGDIINGGYASYDAVLPIYERLTCPRYHVLGNHDYGVAAADFGKVLPRLGLDKLGSGMGWYDFSPRAGWRMIVLNCNTVSIQGTLPGTDERRAAEAILADLKAKQAKSAQTWNGALGPVQREWLRATLDKAAAAGERSIIFCHAPVYPDGGTTLWDDAEVLKILDSARGVAAWMNGHAHEGGYALRRGVHHVNFKGMIEAQANAFALVDVFPDRIHITGFGSEPSRELAISAK